MKKHLIEFIVIFIGITASFLVDEWREKKQNREETIKALELIKFDIGVDTNHYKLRLKRLKTASDRLKIGLTNNSDTLNLEEVKLILKGLRMNSDYAIHTYGYNYFTNNINHPQVSNDTVLIMIGGYHSLSSTEGNYGMFNTSNYQMATNNYERIFELFPFYLDSDSTVANASIRDNRKAFFNDKYWQGRISLMYREATQNMPAVYNKNLNFAERILTEVDKELER